MNESLAHAIASHLSVKAVREWGLVAMRTTPGSELQNLEYLRP